jgi:transposase
VCRRRWKKRDPDEPADHALGRSRGGFSTKIHLLVDSFGHLLAFVITGGQVHETTAVESVLKEADANLHDGDGNPLAWPVNLAGDKGYRAAWIDDLLKQLGINPVIPSKANEDRDARGVEFNRESYRRRNIVERAIGWLKECRRVFSRFDKTAINYCGMIKMAMIERFLKTMCP